jgi:hypothetical protein
VRTGSKPGWSSSETKSSTGSWPAWTVPRSNSVFLKNKTVSLYYYFKPKDQSQAFSLYPLALKDDSLKIAQVTLDGEPFSNFDPKTRTLNLAAGVGGKFLVTFGYGITGVEEAQGDLSPSGFEIFQNYPNPFNPRPLFRRLASKGVFT